MDINEFSSDWKGKSQRISSIPMTESEKRTQLNMFEIAVSDLLFANPAYGQGWEIEGKIDSLRGDLMISLDQARGLDRSRSLTLKGLARDVLISITKNLPFKG